MSNLRNLIAALVSPLQSIEDAMIAILEQRVVGNAVGAQLDAIGALVGQPRNGLADDIYRRYVRARISTNKSEGVREDTLTVANLVVFDPNAYLQVTKEPPAALVLHVTGVALADDVADVLISFLRDAVIDGVRPLLVYSAAEPGETAHFDTEGQGFGGHQALHLVRASSQYATIADAALASRALRLVKTSSQSATITDTASLSITGALTIRARVRFASLPVTRASIVAKSADGGGILSYGLDWDPVSGGRLRLLLSDDGVVQRRLQVTFTPVVGRWYHVVATFDPALGSTTGDTCAIFADSVQLTTVESTTSPASLYNSAGNFHVGDGVGAWDGDVRDVEVHPQALSASAAVALPFRTDGNGAWSCAGDVLDASGNGNDLTLVNAPDFIHGLSVRGAMTMEVLVRPDTAATETRGLINKDENTERGFNLIVTSSGLSTAVYDDAESQTRRSLAFGPSVGEWTRIGVRFDGSISGAERMSIWLDGVKQSATEVSSDAAFVADVAAAFQVGRYRFNTETWDGDIDEGRVWTRALSDAEMADPSARPAVDPLLEVYVPLDGKYVEVVARNDLTPVNGPTFVTDVSDDELAEAGVFAEVLE